MRLLSELYALYQVRRAGAYYSSTTARSGRSSCPRSSRASSGRCWTRPAAGPAAGVPGASAARWPGMPDAEFCLDVTRGDRPARWRSLRWSASGDGQRPCPSRSSVPTGTASAYVDRAQAARRRSRQLALPAGPARQAGPAASSSAWRWAAALEIPAAEQRGSGRVLPAAAAGGHGDLLRRLVYPAGDLGPDLVLRAATATGTRLEVSWDWAYQIGDRRCARRWRPAARTTGSATGRRAGAAGRARAAAGPIRAAQATSAPAGAALPALAARTPPTGFDTMRFTTELLPLLADIPGSSSRSRASPRTTGRPATHSYRRIGRRGHGRQRLVRPRREHHGRGAPDPVPRRLPGPEPGETYLLLPDGAYFSLEKPELQVLARLIEEARALQDSPAARRGSAGTRPDSGTN